MPNQPAYLKEVPKSQSASPMKPPPRPSRLRQRIARARAWVRRNRPYVAAFLLAFAVFFIFDAIRPQSPRITRGDVNKAVAEALANQPPQPSIGSEVYATVAPSVVIITTKILRTDGKQDGSRGTGVILDEMGTILTSLHVVDKAVEIEVLFPTGEKSTANLLLRAPENDIAVLRVRTPPPDLIPAVLGNPGRMSVGDEVFAIGNPFGINHSMTAGVISGMNRTFKPLNRTEPLKNLIQFDAAVNPGNSGGPLVNRDGEVIGIVTGLINPTDQEVFIGIGFAVRIDTAAGAAGSPPY